MSGAHRVAWWGALDPFTFVVWIATHRFEELPQQSKAMQLFLDSLIHQPAEDHVAYVDGLTEPGHRAIAVTAFTAYGHEWRHWYDLTSTPWGIARTASLVDFYLTLLKLDHELRGMSEVFVPLTTWSSRPEVMRAAYPDLTPLSPGADGVLREAVSSLRSVDAGLLRQETVRGCSISPLQLLESLAMLEQERLAAAVFGPPAATTVRFHIASTPGQGYYTAIDLVRGVFGADRPDVVTAVLESALHADINVRVDGERMTPGVVLDALLAVPRERMRSDPVSEVAAVVERLMGRPPAQVAADTFVLVTEWLTDVLPDTPSDGASEPGLREKLISAVQNGLLWGTSVRLGLPEVPYYDHWLDMDRWQATPAADPYDLPAPVVVESATGWFLPTAYAHKHGYLPIAGPHATGRTFLTAYPNMKLLGLLRAAKNSDCVDLAVWSPRRRDVDMDVFAYLQLPLLVRELMYWRGLVFGSGAISPKTFSSTTLSLAYERGQRLRGPQMTSPPPGPIDPRRLRSLVREAALQGGFDAVTDLLVHAAAANER